MPHEIAFVIEENNIYWFHLEIEMPEEFAKLAIQYFRYMWE